MTYEIGDRAECAHDSDWCNAHRSSDDAKAVKLGKPGGFFMGNASAYMHTDEAYVITEVTSTGGLRLRGFAATVSPSDVRPSTRKVRR